LKALKSPDRAGNRFFRLLGYSKEYYEDIWEKSQKFLKMLMILLYRAKYDLTFNQGRTWKYPNFFFAYTSGPLCSIPRMLSRSSTFGWKSFLSKIRNFSKRASEVISDLSGSRLKGRIPSNFTFDSNLARPRNRFWILWQTSLDRGSHAVEQLHLWVEIVLEQDSKVFQERQKGRLKIWRVVQTPIKPFFSSDDQTGSKYVFKTWNWNRKVESDFEKNVSENNELT
jgi:hypothetical protein